MNTIPTHAKFSLRAALKFGFNAFVDNIVLFILFGLAVIAAYGATSLLVKLISYTAAAPAADTVARVCVIAISILSGVYMTIISLLIIDNKEVTLSALAAYNHLLLKALWGNFIYTIMIVFGFICLIIPGVIVAIMYYFFLYELIDTNCSVSDAFGQSLQITSGSRWKIFAYLVISTSLLGLSGSLLSPVVYLGGAYIYRRLKPQ